jgi:hypothetical protein
MEGFKMGGIRKNQKNEGRNDVLKRKMQKSGGSKAAILGKKRG